MGVDFAPNTPAFRFRSMMDFRYDPDPEIVGLLDDFLMTGWEGVTAAREMHCSPYTMTRDQNFVLDRVPGHPEIVLFTGGNGRAFKFGPLIGRCGGFMHISLVPSLIEDSYACTVAENACMSEV